MRARRTIFIAVGAAAVGVALGLLAVGGGASADPSHHPLARTARGDLRHMRTELDNAEGEKPGSKTWVHFLKEAEYAKYDFMRAAFGGWTVAGCEGDDLMFFFNNIDKTIAGGAIHGDKDLFASAADSADRLRKAINGRKRPCVAAGPAQAALAGRISKFVHGLEAQRAASEAEMNHLQKMKRSFLGEEAMYGCRATKFLDLTEAVDIPLFIAEVPYVDDEEARAYLENLFKRGRRASEHLLQYWTEVVPCDPGQPVPPTTTTTSTDDCAVTNTCTTTTTTTDDCTVTNTCTPPPQCSDGVDNDSNGITDLNDPGCMSAPDTVERTSDWNYQYPGDGFSITDWLDFKPYFGALVGQVLGYRVFYGMGMGTTVHMSNTPNHGATPISGTMPCADLGATGISAGIGGQAPTGGSLPAPPDSDHMRIAISTSDQAGGGTCGSGTTALKVATDMR